MIIIRIKIIIITTKAEIERLYKSCNLKIWVISFHHSSLKPSK